MRKILAAMHRTAGKGYITWYERALLPLVYMFIYMKWFNLLEDMHPTHYYVMHSMIDDHIPFVEWFVIPYYTWFLYVFFTTAFLVLLPRSEDFYRAMFFMFIGMTFFLVFSTFVPTAQPLRPDVMPRDNMCTRLILRLYRQDTPTNVFPSIHVFNSIACMIALLKSRALDDHRLVRAASCVLSAAVILSTMFIKQHSVIDVAGAFVLAVIAYRFAYQSDFILELMHIRERESAVPQRITLFG